MTSSIASPTTPPAVSPATSSPASAPLLLALANEIQVGASLLAKALEANRLPHPSFAVDGPMNVVPAAAPQHVHDAATAVADAASTLYQLVTGPSELLFNFQASYQTMFALQWLLHFGLLSSVPEDGTISYAEMATLANVPEAQLKSVARMAMTSNILREPALNQVAHTAVSVMFVRNKSMRDWAGFMFDASIPTAASMVKATEKWPGSVQKTETAYNVAFKHEMPFFHHLSQNPKLTEQFSGYMKSVTDGRGTDLVHLVQGYDWGDLPKHALVVDVGGSTGHAALALAHAFPNLRFEVQDLAPVVKNGLKLLETQDADMVGRVSFRSHDFFEEQPTKYASVYMLRMIIHDWPDAEAIKILRNITAALSPKSALLIMDTVLPGSGTIPYVKERALRVRDLTMAQVFNSKERSTDDWERLLQQTDSRLHLVDVRQPRGSHMSLMQVMLI